MCFRTLESLTLYNSLDLFRAEKASTVLAGLLQTRCETQLHVRLDPGLCVRWGLEMPEPLMREVGGPCSRRVI